MFKASVQWHERGAAGRAFSDGATTAAARLSQYVIRSLIQTNA
jgi:hypothetical protein